MNRADVIRLARNAGMEGLLTDVVCTLSELELFGHYAIEEFLTSSGQYLTNDATREAAIADALTERIPMTEAEIADADPLPHHMFDKERVDFARAIERFHRIGVKPWRQTP